MNLTSAATKLDAVLGGKAEARQESISGREQALSLMRYVFSKNLLPDSAAQIGEALEAGALAVEVEEDFEPGTVSIEALHFLESLLDSFRANLIERMGADPEGRPDLHPVDFACQYYLVHNRFPPAADKKTIAAAMRKLASLPKK